MAVEKYCLVIGVLVSVFGYSNAEKCTVGKETTLEADISLMLCAVQHSKTNQNCFYSCVAEGLNAMGTDEWIKPDKLVKAMFKREKNPRYFSVFSRHLNDCFRDAKGRNSNFGKCDRAESILNCASDRTDRECERVEEEQDSNAEYESVELSQLLNTLMGDDTSEEMN